MPLHYSEGETLADISYCASHCATPGNQQDQTIMEEASPLFFIIFEMPFHSSEDQTRVKIYIKHFIVQPQESNNTNKA